MRKMTPMILVILMLASVLSSIDVYELQEQKEFEETSARSGADPEVSYVTSPRETLYVDGKATNELLAGKKVNFKAWLKNSGDADLTNMQYTVTVYDSLNGQRGDIAKSDTGTDLAWANDKAVCPQSDCGAATLAPGQWWGNSNGEATLNTTSGTVIEWYPQAGEYIVEVKVSSQVLGDPGNNEISYRVSVKDYHDIKVDVTWLDENANPVKGAVQSAQPVDFKVKVELETSLPNFNIRTTNMSITVTSDGNAAKVDGSSQLYETIGESKTVTISDDGSGNAQTASRLIVGHDEDVNTLDPFTGEKTFTLQPPTDGEYQVEVKIESYYVFDNNDGCAGADTFCERLIAGTDAEDEFSGNNAGKIFGSADAIHDITLTNYYLSPISNVQQSENGEAVEISDQYGFIGGEITEPLSTGEYLMVAVVEQTSTSDAALYEWNVTFTITDGDGNLVVVKDANECTELDGTDQTHAYLGTETDRTTARTPQTACAKYTFAQGEYSIKAEAHLIGHYDEITETLDDRKGDDIPVNNHYTYDVNVVNFKPQILTLNSQTREAVVGDSVTVTTTAFDVEGDKLTYSWFDGNGAELACDTPGQATCAFTVTTEMVPKLDVRVRVADPHQHADDTMEISVSEIRTSTSDGLDKGLIVSYTTNLKTTGFTADFANGSLDAVTNTDCANTPTPAGAVVVNPVTSYDSSVLISHSITIKYPADLDIMQVWMSTGSSTTTIASGEAADSTSPASYKEYSYTFPSGSDIFAAGTTFYLIAEDCETPDPPTGKITSLTATPMMGGDIVIAYNYDVLLTKENVRITVCIDDSGCATPEVVYDRVSDDSRSVTYSSGTHNTVYDVTAALCNQYACGDSVSVNATSDSEVADVNATDVTITESGENWVVKWTADKADDDVAGWYVCYNRGEFTATEMKILIDANACKMVMGGTETTIAKYTTVETTQVHFGIVPHDAVMNIAYGPSTDSILYERAQDTTNPDDGTTTTDSETSSGVPTWTWGVIGAVVVVAFIVGAFILSRGEGEGDDDKEWDY